MKTDSENKQDEAQNASAVRDCLARLVRHLLILWHHKEITEALEVSWYAMEKHALAECEREINISKKMLRKIGSLPNDESRNPETTKGEL